MLRKPKNYEKVDKRAAYFKKRAVHIVTMTKVQHKMLFVKRRNFQNKSLSRCMYP